MAASRTRLPPDRQDPGTHRGPLFHGWYVVASVFAVLTVCSGLTVYSLSVYLHAFTAAGRFDMAAASFASGCFSMAAALSGAMIGRLLERHDVRLVMSGGCLLMVAAFFYVPWIDSAQELGLFYLVLGVGYGATALIPGTTLVTRWFVRQRSTAMSIAATGNSFGAIVFVPPVAWAVAQLGINGAGPWLALTMAVGVLPVTWLVLRSSPQAMGLLPLGQDASSTAPSAVAIDATYRAAARSRYFKGMSVAFMLGMAAHVAGQTHLFNRLLTSGQSPGFASMAIAAMAAASVLARPPAVWALNRMSPQSFMSVLLLVQGVALWGCGAVTEPIPLLACVVAYGSTLGNFVTSQSLLLAEAYGSVSYARLYGLSRVWSAPGALLGPGLMGLIYQASDSYLLAYVAIGTVSVAGLMAVHWAGRPSEAGNP